MRKSPANRRRSQCAMAAAVLALVVHAMVCQAFAADVSPTPIDLQPYRVRIEVSFDVRPENSSTFREAVLIELRDGIDCAAGNLWSYEVTQDRLARPAGLDSLYRLRAGKVSEYSAADLEKLFFVSIEGTGGGYRIAGREWDTATTQLGPVHEQLFPDRKDMARRLVLLLRALFRPIAAVTQAKGGPVVLRAHGGALTPPDENWLPLRDGAMFEAYYRHFNKDQVVERIQPVPWTYLTIEGADRGTSGCSVTSGLRAAFSARRRRIDVVALEVTRQVAVTRLTLLTRPPERRPLGGIEVEVSHDPHPVPADQRASGGEQRPRLVSDRNGYVWIPAPAETLERPIWLFVRSGQNLLARIPFVPGIRAEQVLELPDDNLRLEVEGQVAQLQSELVDAVAKRAVVMALARKRAKDRDWNAVDQHLKELAAMPRVAAFSADLSAVRLNAQKQARKRKDKSTEARINKLCDETALLINDYLDEEKLKEFRDEIAELRQIADEDAAAEKDFKARQAAEAAKAAGPNAAPPAVAPAKPAERRPGL